MSPAAAERWIAKFFPKTTVRAAIRCGALSEKSKREARPIAGQMMPDRREKPLAFAHRSKKPVTAKERGFDCLKKCSKSNRAGDPARSLHSEGLQSGTVPETISDGAIPNGAISSRKISYRPVFSGTVSSGLISFRADISPGWYPTGRYPSGESGRYLAGLSSSGREPSPSRRKNPRAIMIAARQENASAAGSAAIKPVMPKKCESPIIRGI